MKSAGFIMAAGSLRGALDDVIAGYRAAGGETIHALYGPSGSIRQRIEAGAKMDVFASASLQHLDTLADAGFLEAPVTFACNALCLVSRPELTVDAACFVDVLCNPALRLATSTPGSDPMGDYTWQLFRNIDIVHSGAFERLDRKAIRLSGGHIPAENEPSPYLLAFAEDKTDVYIMYSTNALVLKQCMPQLQILRIPDTYNVRCEYGIAAATGSALGRSLTAFVRSDAGQRILHEYGFDTPP
jgi:ABC-type molybdate transport system substrate-binding protein